jgi:hypothetical protein
LEEGIKPAKGVQPMNVSRLQKAGPGFMNLNDRRGAGENHNFQRFFGPVEATI